MAIRGLYCVLVTLFVFFAPKGVHAGICDWLLSRNPKQEDIAEVESRPDIEAVVTKQNFVIHVDHPESGSLKVPVAFSGDSDSFGQPTFRIRYPAKSRAEGFLVFSRITQAFNVRFHTNLQPEESPIDEDDFQTGYLEARRLQAQFDGLSGYEIYFHAGRGETDYSNRLLEVLREDFQLQPDL